MKECLSYSKYENGRLTSSVCICMMLSGRSLESKNDQRCMQHSVCICTELSGRNPESENVQECPRWVQNETQCLYYHALCYWSLFYLYCSFVIYMMQSLYLHLGYPLLTILSTLKYIGNCNNYSTHKTLVCHNYLKHLLLLTFDFVLNHLLTMSDSLSGSMS